MRSQSKFLCCIRQSLGCFLPDVPTKFSLWLFLVLSTISAGFSHMTGQNTPHCKLFKETVYTLYIYNMLLMLDTIYIIRPRTVYLEIKAKYHTYVCNMRDLTNRIVLWRGQLSYEYYVVRAFILSTQGFFQWKAGLHYVN